MARNIFNTDRCDANEITLSDGSFLMISDYAFTIKKRSTLANVLNISLGATPATTITSEVYLPTIASATSSSILYFDTSTGKVTYGAAPTSGVSSAQGTLNQVLVNGTTGSAQTGALTFTLPQSIGTSSVVQFGALGIGGAAANQFDVFGNVNGSVVGRVKNSSTGSSAYSAFAIGNDGANNCALFLNSSTRATDGGVNTATLRNDAGGLRLLSSGSNGISIAATTGFVGIGTAAPDYKLHANGYLGVWDSGLLPGYNNTGNKFSSKIIMGNAYSPVIRAFYPNNTYTDSIDLQFLTSGPNIPTENVDPKMVIKAMTGNVGIGATAPTHKLDVLGDIKTYSSANDVMLLVSPNSGNYIRIDAWNQANSVQKPIVLNQTGGNVGIGIVNPTTTLQLWNGSKGGQISLGQQGDPTPYMNMGMDTSWQQYICNNAQWTGSAYNYVSTGGYGGKASRICQENGNIYFDVAYGGSNPITWDRRLNIQNSGAVICGGTFSAPTVNATSSYQKNGTNIVSLQANAGSWSLNSGTSSYSAGHGLGALPSFVQFHYVCTTADFNWAIGDRLPVSCDAQVSDHVGTPWFNASTIGFRFSAPPRLIAMDKTLNVVRQLTTSSWWMEWRAYREI